MGKWGKGGAMGKQTEREPSEISLVLDHLIQRSGKNLREIANEIGVPYQTLYNIRTRNSQRTDLKTLKSLADYFHEDLSIFLGLEGYRRPLQLSAKERELLENYRALSDAARTRADELIGDMAANPKNRRREEG